MTLTSREHFDSNVVEVDGVLFETLIPERVLTIPNNETKVRVKFGIRVTNLSPIPYRFVFFYLIPELQKSDGQSIQNSYVRNATKTPAESDFLLAKPTNRLTFFNCEFYWYNYQLILRGYDETGGIWTFQNLQSGIYRVYFIYENSSEIGKIDGGRTHWKFLERLWTGVVSTPQKTFQLIYP